MEQEAELAELRPKVAQQKQKQKESNAKEYQARKAAVARVAGLEALAEQGPLTVGQEAELAELRPKVAQQKQKQKEKEAKYRREGKAAVARVVELEALAEQGPLTVGQEAELAELRPKAQQKAQQKQKKKDYDAARAGKVAADRVVELEALAERGPLTVEQEAELAELRLKAQQWQKQKEEKADRYREGKAAAARVAELEALKERGLLTEEQGVELAELRPKAQQWQKKKERDVERYRARRAAARVAELEALKERGLLTDEQEAELRSKVAGRDKEVREVTETGVGGAPVADRGVGPEGVSGWAGADQVDWDGWSADVDLDAWFARAVADVDGVQVPQGAVDAGVMLGGGADGEFVGTELPAFLGQDAGDDVAGVGGAGAVAGGLISPVSSPTTPRWRVRLGCLGVKALTGCFSVSRLRRARRGRGGGWPGFAGGGGWGGFSGVRRRKVQEPAAVGGVSGSSGDGGSGVRTPTEQVAQRDPNAERKRKRKEYSAKYRRVAKEDAVRVVELEAKGLGLLTEEEEAELAELQPRVAQRKQQKNERNAKYRRVGKEDAVRVVELEAKGLGQLTEEEKKELAELQPRVAQRKQKKKEENAERSRARKDAAVRVVELEALKEQGLLTEAEEAELAELRPKAQQWQKQKEGNAERSRARKAAAARVVELEALKEQGPLTEAEEAELAELRPKAQQWQKKKEWSTDSYREGKAAAARVVELEALEERGLLTEAEEAELAELRPKAQQWQKQKEGNAERSRARKAAAARVVELEALEEQGPLTEAEEAELAELRPKAQQWQKKKEWSTDSYREGKAAAARVVELEALEERGPLTEAEEAELAELRPKAQQWQKQKEENAKRHQEVKTAAARVVELEDLREQGPLTDEQETELAELRPKAKWLQKREGDANQAIRTAAARVVELEELREQGPLTEAEEAELAELRPRVAQQKQKKKEKNAKHYRAKMDAAVRVAELEALEGLTEAQAAELAELRPKAQQWQKQKEEKADRYRGRKAAAVRVAELEALEGLTEAQAAELVELRPKAQQWQKQKEAEAKYRRGRMDAAVRVAELEALEGLTEAQEVELAELRPKAQQWQKQKERFTDWYRAGKAAAVRVMELEELKEQELLTEAEELELAELRPKAQQWQKKKESAEKDRRAKSAAAARVVVLEALEGVTEEQEVELAGLRARVAGRGREKQDREVRGTGVGGAPVVGRGVGSEGVSGWAGADQDGRDVWSADVDLDAWLARVVPDEEGVQVPQGAADAGVMLDEGAYEEFVETELLAFLGQDAWRRCCGCWRCWVGCRWV